MPFPFSEDAASIFAGGDFGTAVITIGTATSTVYGMFDAAFADPLGMEGAAPRFTCAAADVAGLAHGSTLVVGTSTYKAIQIEADGIGNTLIRLQQQ